MTDDPHLPDDLAWRDDGHVSDEVVTALADGQRELVPLEAYTHVHSCAACGERLGHQALLASIVDAALVPDACPAPAALDAAEVDAVLEQGEPGAMLALGAAPAGSIEPLSGRRLPLPVPALTAALVLAALGAVPTAVELAPRLPQLAAALAQRVPGLLRAVAVLARAALDADGSLITVTWTVAGVVLLTFGLLVTRLLPLQTKGETP